MKTVNISLTEQQFETVESITRTMGFANRSELFRALVRFVTRRPEVLAETEELIFRGPPTRSVKKMMKSFADTGKYSDDFLKSLEESLKESTYFRE